MHHDENAEPPLAHSPPEEGLPGDPYARHIAKVREGATARAKEIWEYATNISTDFIASVETAAAYHDLGKLDPEIQKVLHAGRGGKLKWDHIDAGVAHLSRHDDWMAAWLVRGHHAPGLPAKRAHFTLKTDRRLRGRRREDERDPDQHSVQIERTDAMLATYLSEHMAVADTVESGSRRPMHGLSMRLALSCLVDADHADAAFFDKKISFGKAPDPRWNERLESLVRYVQSLGTGRTTDEKERNRRRSKFFDACLHSRINAPMAACEAPVGFGKTTAVTAYLIRRARNEGLRRLIIVAPFTNILTQNAHVLRKALVLEGEDPDEVIVEHHHRADFSDQNARSLAVLWRAPIVLTTAVSFFETLAACDPGTLRKLHALPGSAIFLDEAHAALPMELWPQNWNWLCELADTWGCRFVFASGSLVRFWEDHGVVKDTRELPELLPSRQSDDAHAAERSRIRFETLGDGRVQNVEDLICRIQEAPGPRLAILSTVKNAAIVAKKMRDCGFDVMHLSTALTPDDREKILERVFERLQCADMRNWTLVATSCVEAGVDFSFRTAFRERFSAPSLIQVSGRVNRNGEYNQDCGSVVYDFALEGEGITQHPAVTVSSDVVRHLMSRNAFNLKPPSELVTFAIQEELKLAGGLGGDLLIKAESEKDYPLVKELGRVIRTDSRFVVIHPQLKIKLAIGVPVKFRELLSGSVQLWSNKIEKLGLRPLGGFSDVYEWTDDYDPDFLGYMDAVLRDETFLRNNDAWII